MACAAFLLSRTDTAPMLLTRDEVEHLAKIAEAKVHEAVGRDFTTRYSYGPYLLVGLLRWRLKEPWALVAGRDETADRLLAATQRLADDLAGKVDGKTASGPLSDRAGRCLQRVGGQGHQPQSAGRSGKLHPQQRKGRRLKVWGSRGGRQIADRGMSVSRTLLGLTPPASAM
ncbi:hypothetical protein ACFOHS_19875 [Jhaorihella thermophila]